MASTPMVKAKNTSDSHAGETAVKQTELRLLVTRDGNFLRYIR